MSWVPCLVESDDSGHIRLGHPLVDRYLEFVAARGRRNTLLAAAYDLRVFFSVVAKDPVDVTTADVLELCDPELLAACRRPQSHLPTRRDLSASGSPD